MLMRQREEFRDGVRLWEIDLPADEDRLYGLFRSLLGVETEIFVEHLRVTRMGPRPR